MALLLGIWRSSIACKIEYYPPNKQNQIVVNLFFLLGTIQFWHSEFKISSWNMTFEEWLGSSFYISSNCRHLISMTGWKTFFQYSRLGNFIFVIIARVLLLSSTFTPVVGEVFKIAFRICKILNSSGGL